MTQIEIVKAFLSDAVVQTKYGITPDDVMSLTMSNQLTGDAQVFVNLVRQMVMVTDDSGTLVTTAAARLNSHLETALR